MNKTFSTAIFAVLFSIFILFTSTAQANLILTLEDTPMIVYQDNSNTSNMNINNNGSSIATITLTPVGLPANVNIPSFPKTITLNPYTNITIAYTINAQNDASIGKKVVTIYANTSTESTSADLSLDVRRNFCEIGPEGDDISVKIRDPDSNNNFDAGDTISIEIRVYSDDDVDFDLSAELYDITTNKVIYDDTIENLDLNDNEDDDYTIDLQVPYNIDPSDDYVINVKAEGENSDDDNQCQQDTIPVQLNKKRHALVVDKVTYSDTLSCNMPIDLSIRVANAGESKEEDVDVTISSSSLNLSSTLRKDIDEEYKATYTFSDILPTVAPGKYTLTIDVSGDTASAHKTVELNLQANCKAQKQDASIAILQQNTALLNQDVVFKTTLSNTGDKTTTYTINALNYQSWATLSGISPTQVTLGAGESKDIIITLKPNANASSSNTFQVKATFGTQTKTQDTVVTISGSSQKPTITGGSIGTTIKNNIWLFIINLVLILVIIGLIILLAIKPKKKQVIEIPREARLRRRK